MNDNITKFCDQNKIYQIGYRNLKVINRYINYYLFVCKKLFTYFIFLTDKVLLIVQESSFYKFCILDQFIDLLQSVH